MPELEVSSAFSLYQRETGEAGSNNADNPLVRYKQFMSGPNYDEYFAMFTKVSFTSFVRHVQHCSGKAGINELRITSSVYSRWSKLTYIPRGIHEFCELTYSSNTSGTCTVHYLV